MQSNPVSARAYWRLIRDNRNFRRLWGAQVVSELGDWFYTLAVYSLLLEFTGSAAAVGLAVVLQLLPQTFAGPISGVVNDRSSRQRIMIGTDIARAGIVLFMMLARTPETVWIVYPLLFCQSVMVAFFEPARNATIPNITSRRELMVANTLASTTWSFNLAIGAMLGGVVAALAGRDTVFVLTALGFLCAAALIRRLRFDEPHMAGLPRLRLRDLANFSPIMDGFRYIRSERRLLATVFVKFGLGLMGSNNVILPILGERVFPVRLEGLTPERGAVLGMSLLLGARGAGSLLGPFMAGAWSGQSEPRLRLGILFGFLFAAVGYVALGFSPNAWTAMGAVVFAHAGSSSVWVFSTTLLHLYTQDKFRGRVFAADVGLLTLTISLTSYLAGALVDWGLPARVFASGTGLLMLLPAAVWGLVLRPRREATSG